MAQSSSSLDEVSRSLNTGQLVEQQPPQSPKKSGVLGTITEKVSGLTSNKKVLWAFQNPKICAIGIVVVILLVLYLIWTYKPSLLMSVPIVGEFMTSSSKPKDKKKKKKKKVEEEEEDDDDENESSEELDKATNDVIKSIESKQL